MPECANGEQYLWQFIDKKDDLMVVDSFVKAMKREQLEGDAVQMNIFDYEESEGNDEK